MNATFAFSLIVSLVTLLLYPISYWLVNRCTAFRFNRFCLIGCMVVSIMLPILLFSFDDGRIVPIMGTVNVFIDNVNVVEAVQSETSTDKFGEGVFSIIPWLIVSYFVGIAILFIREVISYGRLLLLIMKCDRTVLENVILCRIKGNEFAPFSWGKYIFISDEDSNSAIMLHEKAHALKRHWIDIAFADLFCIVVWYNPFAWLIKSLIKLNHEYEADAMVIDSDVNIRSYQQLLITKAMSKRLFPLTNSFVTNKRSFRKRVMIMSSSDSSKKHKWIVGFVIPAMAVAVLILSTSLSASILRSITDHTYFTEKNTESEPFINDMVAQLMNKETEPTKRVLLSPINDPEPIRKEILLAFEAVDKDLLPEMMLVRLAVDEDGNIVSATSDQISVGTVNMAIDKVANEIQFEVVSKDGKKVRTQFAIPIHIKK